MAPDPEARYGIAELAALGGVTRRTVRYYVQEGLLPAPLGVGRGQHYGPAHLERLLQVKELQERGRTLSEIRSGDGESSPDARVAASSDTGPPALSRSLSRSVWRRLAMLPGVELHVAAGVRLPPSEQLDQITRALRRAFSVSPDEDDSDA